VKKIALVLVAAMVLVFTGCEKKETISMPFDVADVNNIEMYRNVVPNSAEKQVITKTDDIEDIVPFPVSWTVKMKKKQKETQDILSYHTQAAGCSDKARAKASGGRQPIEECGRTGL